MKKFKRLLSLLLMCCLILTYVPMAASAVGIISGDCGDNVRWEYDTNSKVFTVSGTGSFYTSTVRMPWHDFRKDIETVSIQPGVTNIGCNFCGCTNLTTVTIPNSVTSIGLSAFEGCTSLRSIAIPASVVRIWNSAFLNCTQLKDIYYGGSKEQWKAVMAAVSDNAGISSQVKIHFSENDSGSNSATDTCQDAKTIWQRFLVADEYLNYTKSWSEYNGGATPAGYAIIDIDGDGWEELVLNSEMDGLGFAIYSAFQCDKTSGVIKSISIAPIETNYPWSTWAQYSRAFRYSEKYHALVYESLRNGMMLHSFGYRTLKDGTLSTSYALLFDETNSNKPVYQFTENGQAHSLTKSQYTDYINETKNITFLKIGDLTEEDIGNDSSGIPYVTSFSVNGYTGTIHQESKKITVSLPEDAESFSFEIATSQNDAQIYLDDLPFNSNTTYNFTENPPYRFTLKVMGDTQVQYQVEIKAPDSEEEPEQTFTDVPTSAWYYEPVKWAVENGVTAGTSATTFSPNAVCTRAQAVTFLWNAAGGPEPNSSYNPFYDVSVGEYYYKAVLWAVENQITGGTDSTHFSPDETCTRAQIVTFLYHAASSPAVSGSGSFNDVKAGSYYENAVKWAVENGITSGTGNGKFSPNDNCIRAQIVTFLYYYSGNVASAGGKAAYRTVLTELISEQNSISNFSYQEEAKGFYCDLNSDGTDELIVQHWLEKNQIGYLTASVYTILNGQCATLLEREPVYTLAGGPHRFIGVMEKDNDRFLCIQSETGETGGGPIHRYGWLKLYSLAGGALSVSSEVQYSYYTKATGEIDTQKSDAVINGYAVPYSQYQALKKEIEASTAISMDNGISLKALLSLAN